MDGRCGHLQSVAITPKLKAQVGQVTIMSFSILTMPSGNRFRDLSTLNCDDSQSREAFEGIKELYLDDCFMTWEDVCSLALKNKYPC